MTVAVVAENIKNGRKGVRMSEDDEKLRLERKLESFFHGLNAGLKVLREVRSAYNESMAFEFNSLNFLEPNENKISEIIAFFLDPHEAHGQKNNFLRIFLNTVLADSAQTELLLKKTIKVTPQEYTSNGRPVDIVIQFGNNDYLIGIENKVFGAIDQDAQVRDYAADLKKRSERSNGNFLILFLSREGERPSEKSISAGEIIKLGESFKILRFNSKDAKDSIITLFREFEKVCMADNVRAFIKDFIKYLKIQFILGENIMGENDFIKDFMSKDENMTLALKVLYCGVETTIREKILEKIKPSIEKFCDGKGLICQVSTKIDELVKDSNIFAFKKNSWIESTEIFFSLDSNNMRNCYYGILSKDKKFLENIKEKFGFSSNCGVHSNSYYSEYQHWDSTQPWLDMITLDKNGDSIFLSDLFDKVDKVLVCAEHTAKKMGIKL